MQVEISERQARRRAWWRRSRRSSRPRPASTSAAAFGAVGAMRDKLLAGTPRGCADPHRGPDRRACRQRAMWWPVRLPTSAWCEPRSPCAAAIQPAGRRRGQPACGPAGSRCHLFPRSEARDRRHPFRQGAGSARHRRGRGGSPAALSQRRHRHARDGESAQGRPIGCTQVTEILDTPGVTLVAPLPQEFELATIYTAAVAARAASPDQARRLVALLSGPSARSARPRRLRAASTHHPSVPEVADANVRRLAARGPGSRHGPGRDEGDAFNARRGSAP